MVATSNIGRGAFVRRGTRRFVRAADIRPDAVYAVDLHAADGRGYYLVTTCDDGTVYCNGVFVCFSYHFSEYTSADLWG